jgi:hypothetical protein
MSEGKRPTFQYKYQQNYQQGSSGAVSAHERSVMRHFRTLEPFRDSDLRACVPRARSLIVWNGTGLQIDVFCW